MKTNLLVIVTFMSALLITSSAYTKDEDKKGYGAGGARGEHASEQGIEKGKAWSGSKEVEKDKEKGTKSKKEKKEK